jgi:hypothetical protein
MVLGTENRTASGLGTTATAIMAGRSIEAHSISNVSVRQSQAYRGRYSGVDGFPAVPGPVGTVAQKAPGVLARSGLAEVVDHGPGVLEGPWRLGP